MANAASLDGWLLAVAALVAVSVLLVPVAAKMRAPVLLVFLGLGMLLGEDGPGGIHFDDYVATYRVGGFALALILLSGGLETRAQDIDRAGGPAVMLASVGVVFTMAFLGGGVYALTPFSALESFLIAAVLSATDAASTFMLLGQLGLKLKNKLAEILSVESGLNDPMAIFLTVTLSSVLAVGEASFEALSIAEVSKTLVDALGWGLVGGAFGGLVIPAILNRVRLPSGLAAVFVLSASLAVFAGTQVLGGSGYLAIYLCGMMTRTRMRIHSHPIVSLHDGMAWLAQIALFLVLGLLVTPHELGNSLGSGLIVAGLLIFVARPVAVALCLLPFGTERRESLFLGWVGLRGAVPIVLTTIPLVGPGPVTRDLFNVVFVAVLASLLLQGWTIPFAAKWLKVVASEEGSTEDGAPAKPD